MTITSTMTITSSMTTIFGKRRLPHPSWNDTSAGAPRLGDVWRWDTSSASFLALGPTEHSAAGPCHGGAVSAIVASDLTQGQDAAVTDTGLRADRSGIALEASLDFIEFGDGSFGDTIDHVTGLNPDVFVTSYSLSGTCDVDDGSNAESESLYPWGIIHAKSAGNDYHGFGSGCSASNPAASAAVLVAGALDFVGVPDLNAGPLEVVSSRGGDVHGRALVDLVAPGRETSNLAMFDDDYSTVVFNHTSAANPVLAGAVTVFKDHLSSFLNSSFYNSPGVLYASMLLMGDGTTLGPCGILNTCSDPGPAATGGTPLDPRWGAGRLRMRLFTPDWMDAPWRARWCIRTVQQNTVATCLANPDATGTNQAIPADVERIRAAAYWFEPNLGSVEDPANIAFAAYRNGGFRYQTGGVAPSKKRLREDAAAGGTWNFNLNGWCVPAQDAVRDPAHPFANCVQGGSRTVYVALYWEDMDREELPAEIQ